jgi:uncharacterized protein
VLTELEKSTNELPKGDFWQVYSEDDIKTLEVSDSELEIDPRLAKLSELFKDEE